MEEDKEIDKLNFDIDQLINKCIILNKDELTATARLMLGRDIILRFINILQKNKYLKKENEQLKNAIAVANKLEERIKENFIAKKKLEDFMENELPDDEICKRCVIYDVNGIYIKEELEKLLESEETNDKNNKKG